MDTTRASRRQARPVPDEAPVEAATRPRAPGILLGIGLGGFVDGIVLHQILQWHHMLTDHGEDPATTVAGLENEHTLGRPFPRCNLDRRRRGHLDPLEANHGLALGNQRTRLRRLDARRLGPLQPIEGIVDDHILGIHHVRETGNQTAWTLGFLAFGALLVIGGWLLARADETRYA